MAMEREIFIYKGVLGFSFFLNKMAEFLTLGCYMYYLEGDKENAATLLKNENKKVTHGRKPTSVMDSRAIVNFPFFAHLKD